MYVVTRTWLEDWLGVQLLSLPCGMVVAKKMMHGQAVSRRQRGT